MSTLLKIVNWKPSTVSWLSFVFMGLIVAGVGLAGTAHVVNYLQLRLVDHGVEHNKEVALALIPKIEAAVAKDPADVLRILSQTIESYKSFGFQIFVLDRSNQSIAVDSKNFHISPIPLKKSWLAYATRLDGSTISLPQEIGSLSSLNADEHLMLIWLQEIDIPEKNRWVLGVANDQKTLIDFMGDLHWHLDAVMLLTYILITFLGYYAVRSIGRAYERRLESEIRDRSQALEAAHEEVLLKTRLATIGKTASVLTHEIRNPLSSIKLALSGWKGSAILEDREQLRPIPRRPRPTRRDEIAEDLADDALVTRRDPRKRRLGVGDCHAGYVPAIHEPKDLLLHRDCLLEFLVGCECHGEGVEDGGIFALGEFDGLACQR